MTPFSMARLVWYGSVMEKRCTTCGEEKPTSEFGKRSRSKDGLMASCTECCAYRRSKYRNSEQGKAKRAEWVRKNAERLNEKRRDRYASNPDLIRERNREWRNNNSDKVREANRRNQLKKYGLTEEDYARMVEEQNGKCLICDQEPPLRNGKIEPLAVDHCHEIGVVRGLLCWKCNGAIGIIGEKNIARAVSYLAKSRLQ